MQRFDALVVGCGAMGSSVAYNLTSRGMKVGCLERFGLNHEFGSSHGRTRIIRLAYYEDARYVPLLVRAFKAWSEVQARAGRTLVRLTGGLMIGAQDGELVSGVLKSAREHGLKHRVLTSPRAMDEFPAFKLDDGHAAVYEDSAGILFPEECISSYVRLAEEAGAEFKFNEAVTSWRKGDVIEVETDKGRYVADKIVFTAGAWTGRLLPGLIPLALERQVPFWFGTSGNQVFTPERMPIFVMEEGPGHHFYGIPDVGHGIKVARHHAGHEVDLEHVDRTVSDADLVPVSNFISRRLPALKPDVIASTTCLYSNTPDMNFVIGLHPEDSRVAVVSACSGHGFKFSSVVGEIASDLLLEGKTPFDISFLNVGRFAKD